MSQPIAKATAASIEAVLKQLQVANGHDAALDRAIARQIEDRKDSSEAPDYTASVDECLDLLRRALPGWHWHLGYGASGIMPYALVTDGVQRFEATAPTVPLALLTVIVKARLALAKRGQ